MEKTVYDTEPVGYDGVPPDRVREILDHIANSEYLNVEAAQQATATKFNVTIDQIIGMCSVNGGHDWTRWEAGDGPWFMSSNDFCSVCGVDRYS